MSPRLKKLIGFAALLPAIILYFFAAAALGERVPDNQLLKVAFYLVAGIAWAAPAGVFIRWMERDPNAPK